MATNRLFKIYVRCYGTLGTLYTISSTSLPLTGASSAVPPTTKNDGAFGSTDSKMGGGGASSYSVTLPPGSATLRGGAPLAGATTTMSSLGSTAAEKQEPEKTGRNLFSAPVETKKENRKKLFPATTAAVRTLLSERDSVGQKQTQEEEDDDDVPEKVLDHNEESILSEPVLFSKSSSSKLPSGTTTKRKTQHINNTVATTQSSSATKLLKSSPVTVITDGVVSPQQQGQQTSTQQQSDDISDEPLSQPRDMLKAKENIKRRRRKNGETTAVVAKTTKSRSRSKMNDETIIPRIAVIPAKAGNSMIVDTAVGKSKEKQGTTTVAAMSEKHTSNNSHPASQSLLSKQGQQSSTTSTQTASSGIYSNNGIKNDNSEQPTMSLSNSKHQQQGKEGQKGTQTPTISHNTPQPGTLPGHPAKSATTNTEKSNIVTRTTRDHAANNNGHKTAENAFNPPALEKFEQDPQLEKAKAGFASTAGQVPTEWWPVIIVCTVLSTLLMATFQCILQSHGRSKRYLWCLARKRVVKYEGVGGENTSTSSFGKKEKSSLTLVATRKGVEQQQLFGGGYVYKCSLNFLGRLL